MGKKSTYTNDGNFLLVRKHLKFVLNSKNLKNIGKSINHRPTLLKNGTWDALLKVMLPELHRGATEPNSFRVEIFIISK